MFHHKASLLFLIGFILIQPISGQVKPATDSIPAPIKFAPTKKITDTTFIKKHSPRKATYLSLICPGLGQIYNHKYWKLPIVYGGFGALAYFFKTNHAEYVKFRDAYNFVTTPGNENAPPVNDYVTRYNKNETLLLSGRDYYRRNLELTYIISGAAYILVAIDAQVDAHFFNFDVSDNLSLNVKPFVQQPSKLIPGVTGVSLCFSF
ncbi:MAG: DUF5683 domain-containing protein [Bacillota bacterium]|nr:DUF5683 domain-containing protein [Bacillota bacterium]